MSRLVDLVARNQVTIPEENKEAFYAKFGQSMQKMLKIKEFTTFYRCLKTFMEWAKTTDLTDLNFMVPIDDQAV